jgi:sn-glycerol 3-phosphate transport system substrate-binding protein
MLQPTYMRRISLGVSVSMIGTSALLLGLLLSVSAGSPAAGAKAPDQCAPSALTKATKPVNIVFWESMSQANATTLTSLTTAFNSMQHAVHVTLVQQGGSDVTWEKYQAGLSNGQLPDLAQFQDTDLQGAIDTHSILPVQTCIDATHYSTSDYVPEVLSYWKVDGVQWALPFAVSNPILYYNKLAFTKAGLNPDKPPATLPQMIADAKVLKKSGYGTALKLDSWHLETWLATADQLFVNNSNGRKGRASKAAFNTATGRRIFTLLDGFVRSGLATTNPSTGPTDYDNLLGIGNGKYAMTIDTSAALGTIQTLLSGGQYPNVKLGIGAFPVLSGSDKGGIEPGGSALYIMKQISPDKQAAAWQYITFLDSTQSQATWSAGTGFIPVRMSSTKTATLTTLWRSNPAFAVAYHQQVAGITTAATSGSVIGDYSDVRTAVLDAEMSMYQSGVSPATALSTASQQVNTILASYNQRIGG